MKGLVRPQLAVTVIAGIMTLACGCSIGTTDTRAADEKAIRSTEAAWSKTAASKDLEGFVSYYTDDAAVLPPNGPICTSKGSTRAALRPMFEAPGFSLTFQATKVEVASSGDIGYSYGTYSSTMNDPKGKPVEDKGKYVTVYRKQADGKWKAIVDTFNSDLPLPPPPAPEPVQHAKAKTAKKAHKKR